MMRTRVLLTSQTTILVFQELVEVDLLVVVHVVVLEIVKVLPFRHFASRVEQSFLKLVEVEHLVFVIIAVEETERRYCK